MKVTLINKEQCKDFYKQWGIFSCKCYNTNPKYAEKVGKSCHKSRHYSGSRSFYFIFQLEDIPRSTIDQLARHEIGVVKNIQSQRYTDSSNLGFYVPDIIKKHDHLLETWYLGFKSDSADYQYIISELEKLEGLTGEQAREIARGRIGIDIHSSATFGFTIEALEHFMHKRLCMRSQEGIRKVANLMKKEILEILPDLKANLVPECSFLGYCNENKMQCNSFKDMYPTKEEFNEIMKTKEYKNLVSRIKKQNNQ
jgi:thymidylate synthase (FAD)